MVACFHVDYWHDDGWLVGQLREVPGIAAQGETLTQLEFNIRDAFSLMTAEPVSDLDCLISSPISAPTT